MCTHIHVYIHIPIYILCLFTWIKPAPKPSDLNRYVIQKQKLRDVRVKPSSSQMRRSVLIPDSQPVASLPVVALQACTVCMYVCMHACKDVCMYVCVIMFVYKMYLCMS